MKKLLTILLLLGSVNVFADNVVLCSPNTKRTDIQQAVKWYRNSAEMKALYRQAYNNAENYIKVWIKQQHPKAKTWGVSLDIDETALDNSWYFHDCSELATQDSDFSHYVANAEKSTALPGVISFVKFVHEMGGYVSLVSNRDGSFSDETGSVLTHTINNLKQQGIYFDQVVLANHHDAKTPRDKNPRFNAIISGNYDKTQMVWSNKLPPHTIIAYVGDNIQDFPKLKQKAIYRRDSNDSNYNSFGSGYFIMPNPMYGSWDSNPYN